MAGSDSALAKVTRPGTRGSLPRRRLFRLLDRLSKTPVTWVQGPPGSGKTTLVSSYLEARNLAALWYHVDSLDSDPASFFYYIGHAAKQALRKDRRALPLLTAEHHSGLPVFTKRFLDRLFAMTSAPRIVVIDDYHSAPENSAFQDLMRSAFESLPDGARFIITSRGPPPPMARLVANGVVAMVDWEHLRLTQSEVAAIARAHARKTAPETAESLFQRTQGWAAGLVLLLEEPRGSAVLTGATVETDPGLLSDYFAGEIFERVDVRLREVLLQTALLPLMSGPMAEALTEDPDAARILEDLSRRNYFTERLASDPPTYRYHPLFRRFLLAQLEASREPSALGEVRERAAELLERADQFEAAAALLRKNGSWEGLAELVNRRAPAMLSHGRSRTLENWLGSLPSEIVAARPWLSFWHGACTLLSDPARAVEHYEAAYEAFTNLGDEDGQFLSLSGITDAVVIDWSHFEGLDRWIGEFERLYGNRPQVGMTGAQAHAASRFLNCLTLRQPQHPQIGLWAQCVEAVIRDIPDPALRVLVASPLSHFYHCTGDFEKAHILQELLRPAAESKEQSPLVLLAWYTIDAVISRNTHDFDRSLAAVRKGLEITRTSGIHFLDFRLLVQGAYTALACEDLDRSREFLEEMRSCLDEASLLDLVHYNYVAACDANLRGEPRLAREYALAAVRDAEETGGPFMEALSEVGLAHVLFDCGEVEEAASMLARSLDTASRIGSRQIVFMGLCARAYFSMRRVGDEDDLPILRRALAIGREQGYLSTPWWRRSMMSALCARALEQDVETDYVRRLIGARDLVPPEGALDLESWPWPVRVRTLGEFEVILNGEPARFSAKAQRRPLELLKALLAFGGRGVGAERLIDALWPDAEGDAAHRSLDTTLHRLRKWIGADRCLVYRDARLSLDPRYCWVDVWAVERRLDHVDAVLQSRGADTDWRAELKRICDLYRYHFLPSESAEWAIQPRERLRGKLVRVLGAVGRVLEAADRWDDAVDCYQRGLEVDAECEALHLRLMLAYEHLGREAEAVTAYRRCTAALKSGLDIAPSQQTEAVYERVRAGHAQRGPAA